MRRQWYSKYVMSKPDIMLMDSNLPSVLEGEVEERVGDLGSALPTEYIHGVPCHSHWEVTAGWGAVTSLADLLPHSVVPLQKN